MSSADHPFDHLPADTQFVVEHCGSGEHGDEFVHSFLEFPNGRIIDFGIAPRLPRVADQEVTAVPSLHDLAGQHRRQKVMIVASRKGFMN